MKTLLLAALLSLASPAMSQEPEAVKAETVVPDAGPSGTDKQVQSNTARLDVQERMTGNQDFILKLLGILVPAAVLIFQIINNRKLAAVATSVDGMKTELVAATLAKGKLQGADTQRKAQNGYPTRKSGTKVRKALKEAE